MKKRVTASWGFFLMLVSMSHGVSGLSAQTPAQIREFQAQLEQEARESHNAQLAQEQAARVLVQERLARAREHELQALQERLTTIREHELQELQERTARASLERRLATREQRERIHQRTQEARERARRALERAQQVRVQIRSRARIGVSLDVRQGREYDARGVLVKGVMDESPAEEAGLEEGDIITHMNGHALVEPLPPEQEEDLDEYESLPVQRLMAMSRELEDGEEVEIRYLRDGQSQRVSLAAAELDDAWTAVGPGVFPRGMVVHVDPDEEGGWIFRRGEGGGWAPGETWFHEFDVDVPEIDIDLPEIHLEGIRPNWDREGPGIALFRGGENMAIMGYRGAISHGVSLQDMTPELGAYFSTEDGVLVLEVHEDSQLGLLPGDVIKAIDGRDVEDRGDVVRILRSYEDGEAVSFLVVRHGQDTRVQGTVE